MGRKPSLTLELDSHTADVGIDTRIEAFLDIIQYWRKSARHPEQKPSAKPLQVVKKGTSVWVKEEGKPPLPLRDRSVKVLIPSMGIAATAIASVLQGAGIRASALPFADMEVLKKGRAIATCKECVPLILTVGLLKDYLDKHYNPEEKVVYFMPEAPGGCRFGQYHVFMKKYLDKQAYRNVGILCLSNEDGYQGIDVPTKIKIFKAVIASDIFSDIRNTISVLAVDKAAGLSIFDRAWNKFNSTLRANGNIEKGLREILNFGHTFGHAIETLTGYNQYKHGEGVAIGMNMAAGLAVELGMLTLKEHDRIKRLITAAGLPGRCTAALSSNTLITSMCKDKKAREGALRFVLPETIGRVVVRTVEAGRVYSFLEKWRKQ
jgi:hypothetical protein